MSWEELFKHMDSDGGGSLDLREFRAAVRSVLKVAESEYVWGLGSAKLANFATFAKCLLNFYENC